jgi:hypothetical protein
VQLTAARSCRLPEPLMHPLLFRHPHPPHSQQLEVVRQLVLSRSEGHHAINQSTTVLYITSKTEMENLPPAQFCWWRRGAVAASTPPATRGRVAQTHRTRETKRETRKLNGECSVVGGPSGVSSSSGTTKAKVRCVTSEIQTFE